MNERSKILRNLNNRVYGVNTVVAVSRTEFLDGCAELNRMVKEGLVDKQHMRGLPLYVLTDHGRAMANKKMSLAVDNTETV